MKTNSLVQILRTSPLIGLELDFSRANDFVKESEIWPEMNITFETIRQIALELPNVRDGLSYGAPALKVNGKELFIRLREDLNAIVLKTTFEEREELMAADPEKYFITDHYLNYEWVLVSLEHVRREDLVDLIRRAYNLAIRRKK